MWHAIVRYRHWRTVGQWVTPASDRKIISPSFCQSVTHDHVSQVNVSVHANFVEAVGLPAAGTRWQHFQIPTQELWQLGPAAINSHKCRSCLCRISVSWRHRNPDLTPLPRDYPTSLWHCQVFISTSTPFTPLCRSFSAKLLKWSTIPNRLQK